MSSLKEYNGIQIVTPDPCGVAGQAINSNFKALSTTVDTTDPSASDDSTLGFTVGSRWYNSSTTSEWICLDTTPGAAAWQVVTSGTLGSYLPLSGGTMTGPLDMGGNDVLNVGTISNPSNLWGFSGVDGSGGCESLSIAGGATMFNADGSGTTANGNMSWDPSGGVTVNSITGDGSGLTGSPIFTAVTAGTFSLGGGTMTGNIEMGGNDITWVSGTIMLTNETDGQGNDGLWTNVSFTASAFFGDISNCTGNPALDASNMTGIPAPAGVAYIGDNVSEFVNDAGYFVPTGTVAYQGDNVSEFTNDAGYLTTAAQPGDPVSEFVNDAGYLVPTGTVAYQGDNVSEFTNDAGYSTFTPTGTVAYQGDNVSEFVNDAGYLVPTGTVAYQGDNVSEFANDVGYVPGAVGTDGQMLYSLGGLVAADTATTDGAGHLNASSFTGDISACTGNPALDASNMTGIPAPAGVAYIGDNVSEFVNDAGYLVPTGTVAYQGDNVSEFTNDAGYLTTAAQPGDPVSEFVNDAGYLVPTGTVAYQGDNVSEFTNDAGYSTFTPTGTVAYQGDNVSEFVNDAGYLVPTGTVAYQGDNVSEFTNDAGYSTFTPTGTVAYQGDNVSEFVNDAGYLVPTGTVAYQGDNVSEFTNDAGYLTTAAQPGDPVSEFTNDAGYLPAAACVPSQYTVATLPTGAEGQIAYATDGLKVGETPGNGTGVPVYFSNGAWRVFSTDAPVAA